MHHNSAPGAIIMVRPHCFSVNTQTACDNAFQSPASFKASDAVDAHREIGRAAEQLGSRGVEVFLFEDEEGGRPDSVFPNNWISTHACGSVILYPMRAPNRRGERRQDIVDFLQRDFRTAGLLDYSSLERDNRFMEGTGAMVVDHADRVAYIARSDRADAGVAGQVCRAVGYRPFFFDAHDANGLPVYHTNVLMFIATGFAAIGLDMVRDSEQRRALEHALKRTGRDLIILREDQIRSFAGNAIELRGSDGPFLAMSANGLASLDPGQRGAIERCVSIEALAMPTIEQAGGSVRCTILDLHLQRR